MSPVSLESTEEGTLNRLILPIVKGSYTNEVVRKSFVNNTQLTCDP